MWLRLKTEHLPGVTESETEHVTAITESKTEYLTTVTEPENWTSAWCDWAWNWTCDCRYWVQNRIYNYRYCAWKPTICLMWLSLKTEHLSGVTESETEHVTPITESKIEYLTTVTEPENSTSAWCDWAWNWTCDCRYWVQNRIYNYRDRAWKLNIWLMGLSLKRNSWLPWMSLKLDITFLCLSPVIYFAYWLIRIMCPFPTPQLAELRARKIRTIHTKSWGWLGPGVRGDALLITLRLAKGECR
jgi:hypothetical protein